jgi:predicted metal-dependent enzyme (double-stranded beta helix superfamily)
MGKLMGYGLSEFSLDLTAAIGADGVSALPRVAEKLKLILANSHFLAAAFDRDLRSGAHLLFRDPESDLRVQAHVYSAGKRGAPHNHGGGWEIHGVARGCTEVTEWRRVSPVSDDHAELEAVTRYWLAPGDAHAFAPNVIHSTANPEKSWVIRVTGSGAGDIPRYRFRPGQDTILANSTPIAPSKLAASPIG